MTPIYKILTSKIEIAVDNLGKLQILIYNSKIEL